MTEVAKFPLVTVAAQFLAYLLLFAFMVVIAKRSGTRSFWAAIRWNWPIGWPVYLLIGLVLAISLQGLAHVLPMPKELPIDRFFQTTLEAWVLSIFGVTLAPFFEELFFRGFLYPALARWLATVFGTPRLARRAAVSLAAVGAWGYLIHGVSKEGRGIVVGAACLVALLMLILRFVAGFISDGLVQVGVIFCLWTFLATRMPGRQFGIASILLLLATGVLARASFSPVGSRNDAGVSAAIVLTAASFGLIHAPQLAQAWAPVLVVFLVGLVLTITRAVTKSVASSLLIHMAYNGTISVLLFLASDGFQHLDKLNQ